MAQRVIFSIPSDHGDLANESVEMPDQASDLYVRFLDAQGHEIGRTTAPATETLTLEHSDGEGGFGWSSSAAPMSLEAPPGTFAAELLAGEAPVARTTELTESLEAGIPNPTESRSIFGTSGWHLRIISERFAAAEPFFAACTRLVTHMRSVRPFNRDGLKWRVTGHFWPSADTVRGLFRTLDPPANQLLERRIFGEDRPLAKAYLDSQRARDMGLVLIDSGRRGGAGGSGVAWPAWCTIASLPNEQWESVALHEVGHAFGLADEYENSDIVLPEPDPLEPNIARSATILPAPWRTLVNVAGPVPTCAIVPTPAGQFGPEQVGTFQGARYDSGRFRPSVICRMRVAGSDFCPVCSRLIEDRLR